MVAFQVENVISFNDKIWANIICQQKDWTNMV